MDNSLKNTLTISMRAGKLKYGFDTVREAMGDGRSGFLQGKAGLRS